MKYNEKNKMIQAYSKAPWRDQVQTLVLALIGISLAAVLGWMYADLSARTTQHGRAIQKMQTKMLVLERDILSLESDLAEITSIQNVQERMDEMGFTPAQSANIVYLEVPGYAGRDEAKLAPPAQPFYVNQQELDNDYTETLFEWLQDVMLTGGR